MKNRDLTLIALGRLIQIGLVFLTIRTVTQVLPTAEVGVFFLISSLVGFFGLVIVNPVGSFVNRELHGWVDRSVAPMALNRFFQFAVLSSVAAVCVLQLILFFPITNWSTSIGSRALLFATGAMVFGSTLSNTYIPALNLLERRGLFVSLTVASQIAALAAAYGFATVAAEHSGTPREASQWLIGTGLAQILFGIFALLLLRRIAATTGTETPSNQSESAGMHPYKNVRSFTLPLVIANVGVWGLTQGYRPLVERRHGLESLAIVGLGLGLAASLSGALETLVHQLFLPRYYRESHSNHLEERTANWRRLWSIVVPVYLGASLFLFLFAEPIVLLLSGESYRGAALYLRFGALSELLRMAGNLFSLHSHAERKTHVTIAPYLAGAAVALVCAALFKPEHLGLSIVAGQLVSVLGLSRSTLKTIRARGLRLPLGALVLFILTPVLTAPLTGLASPFWTLIGSGLAMVAAIGFYWAGLRRRA